MQTAVKVNSTLSNKQRQMSNSQKIHRTKQMWNHKGETRRFQGRRQDMTTSTEPHTASLLDSSRTERHAVSVCVLLCGDAVQQA